MSLFSAKQRKEEANTSSTKTQTIKFFELKYSLSCSDTWFQFFSSNYRKIFTYCCILTEFFRQMWTCSFSCSQNTCTGLTKRSKYRQIGDLTLWSFSKTNCNKICKLCCNLTSFSLNKIFFNLLAFLFWHRTFVLGRRKEANIGKLADWHFDLFHGLVWVVLDVYVNRDHLSMVVKFFVQRHLKILIKK